MKLLILALALALSGCAHVSDYGRGCRDGVHDLGPQLSESFRAALFDGNGLNSYCDAVERQNNKAPRERN